MLKLSEADVKIISFVVVRATYIRKIVLSSKCYFVAYIPIYDMLCTRID